MVFAAVALIFATPLDLKTLVTQHPAEMVARWGAPVRKESWSWTGPYDQLPRFRDVAKYRDVAPVPGWSRSVSYSWQDTPALKNDGLERASASIKDGVTISLQVVTLAREGTRERLREEIYKGLGLVAPPAKKLAEQSESFSSELLEKAITVRSSENSFSPTRLNEPRVQLSASVQPPYPKEFEVKPGIGGKDAICALEFSPEGEPESIEYQFLPIVDAPVDSMPSVGLGATDFQALPSNLTQFKLTATPDWTGSWMKDEYCCILSFSNVRVIEAEFKKSRARLPRL